VFSILGLILFIGFKGLSLRFAANNSVDGSPSSTELFYVFFFLVLLLGGLVWIVGFVVVGVVFMIHWVVSHTIGSEAALLLILIILLIFSLSRPPKDALGLRFLLLLGGLVWIVGFVVVGVVFMIHWVVSHFIGIGVALLSILVICI
jgi:hypothetical protein